MLLMSVMEHIHLAVAAAEEGVEAVHITAPDVLEPNIQVVVVEAAAEKLPVVVDRAEAVEPV